MCTFIYASSSIRTGRCLSPYVSFTTWMRSCSCCSGRHITSRPYEL